MKCIVNFTCVSEEPIPNITLYNSNFVSILSYNLIDLFHFSQAIMCSTPFLGHGRKFHSRVVLILTKAIQKLQKTP